MLISDYEDSYADGCSSSDGGSSVEVSSTIDEFETELVDLLIYLHLESYFNDDNDDQTSK